MQAEVLTLDNAAAGQIDLADEIFGLPARADILQRAVVWQLAKRRQGTHKTKTIGEVSGSGARPWRQKGTGRARHGSRRSPLWRGGAVTFGPVPRDHAIGLPKKVRKLALKTALSVKQAEGKLKVLDAAVADEPRTAPLSKRLAALGLRSALIVDGAELNRNFVRAAANIPGIDVLPQQGANVHDILRHDVLVLTRAAIEQLEARLK